MVSAEIRAFGRSFAVQKRVIGALFMREFMTRWGRRNFGFAWLFAEPLVFAAGELVIPEGFVPTIDGGLLAAHEIAQERFQSPTFAAASPSMTQRKQ